MGRVPESISGTVSVLCPDDPHTCLRNYVIECGPLEVVVWILRLAQVVEQVETIKRVIMNGRGAMLLIAPVRVTLLFTYLHQRL
jgi:hypothetical protein